MVIRVVATPAITVRRALKLRGPSSASPTALLQNRYSPTGRPAPDRPQKQVHETVQQHFRGVAPSEAGTKRLCQAALGS